MSYRHAPRYAMVIFIAAVHLALGASAAQIGTGFLRCPEAKISSAWANALAVTAPEDTVVSRVFSGRAGRSIATDYVLSAIADKAPPPAPYPVQRGLTAAMRAQALRVEQALHAARLAFRHPHDNRVLEFEAPLPTDMLALLTRLRG